MQCHYVCTQLAASIPQYDSAEERLANILLLFMTSEKVYTSQEGMMQFHHAGIESILTFRLTVLYGNTSAQDRQCLFNFLHSFKTDQYQNQDNQPVYKTLQGYV